MAEIGYTRGAPSQGMSARRGGAATGSFAHGDQTKVRKKNKPGGGRDVAD